MDSTELHQRVMERLGDIWIDSFLSVEEFQQAYDEAKEIILEEY